MNSFQRYVVIIINFIFLFSCNHHTKNKEQIFYYNESRDIATLDPAFAKSQSVMWAIHQIFNRLVDLDSNMNIVPSVAKSWDVSADFLIYTFHLRNDVFFQNNAAFKNGKGRRLTAQDVAYSLNRIIDANTASTGAWLFNNRIAQHGFIALNDTTFQLKLLRPFHPILNILSMDYCSVVPHEAVEKYGKDFGHHPCGSGAFQFKFWDDGQALILQKNQHYWEYDKNGKRLPYLDAIDISFNANKAMEFLQFRQGRLNFISDIEPSFQDEVITKTGELRKQWQGKIVLEKQPYLNIEYLGILLDENNPLVKNSPLKIKSVRQAMSYAIDKKQLMMYLRNSIGTPANSGFAPSGLPSSNTDSVKGYNYNPTLALKLLNDAGFPNGKGLPAITLSTSPQFADVCDFVAKQENNIGIKVQVEVLQKSMMLQQTAQQQCALFLGSWIADYPDAENYMACFYGKNPAPPNYTRYKNKAFDDLYEQSLQENNDSVRYSMYRKLDQMMIDDAPVIPIFYDEVIRLVQPDVRGFQTNALNTLELKNVYFQK
ncbi:ABC transporter substrate-binding protein [Arachidicoccus ginsenosidimutans]|uniref:ABC transporter substrate-binding protein n=1 Tax=Arachidicoccus sp. BS20 TaxID=1850526 RepID=UPI0007F0CAFC|nr:ABC transporter substrate-binding protein [Arachidicoccus sp. BS20]ANI88417.1 ABC transporter substrate-binding protein [Arachidicoccus sp. BS20]